MYLTLFKRFLVSLSHRFTQLFVLLIIPLLGYSQTGQPATHVDQVALIVGLANSPDSPNNCENCLEAEVPLFFQFTQGSGSYDPDYFRACDLVIKGHIEGDFASLIGQCDVGNLSFLAKRAPCGPLDNVAHSFEIDPAFVDGQHFIIRQNPSEELFYEESTQSSPFGRIMARALPGSDFGVFIDDIHAEFDCGGSTDLLELSGNFETQATIATSCSAGGVGPEFFLAESSYEPSTNRFLGEINVTSPITANQVSASFKISSTIGSPSIDDLEVLSTTATSTIVREEGGDFYLTLEYSGSVDQGPAAGIEITYPAGTPPNSIEFEFESVNAVALSNVGGCCVIDVESSTHPTGTTPPCANQSGASLEYGYATFVAQTSNDCGVDIQLGWNADPSISGLMQWLGTPQSAIKVLVEGENIGAPTAALNTSNCSYNNAAIDVQQVGVTSPTGFSTYEISFQFFNSTCVTDGPFLDIKVPSSDPSLTGKVTNVQYSSAVANIAPQGPSGGGNCSHAAIGISDEIILEGDFGGQVYFPCRLAPLEDVEMCFTESCSSATPAFCSTNTNGVCEATAVTDIDGNYTAPASLTGTSYYATPFCKPGSPAEFVTTFDLYLIGQHILGITPFQSWFQLEAADANCNGSISAFDMTRIRRVILGLDPDFVTCDSWQFYAVDGNGDPLATSCQPNDCGNPNPNFAGVKTGDVNCNGFLTNSPADLTADYTVGNDESTLDVSIENGPTDPIVAYEFEIEVSEEIIGVRNSDGTLFEESAYTLTEEGIRFAYVAGMPLSDDDNAAIQSEVNPDEEGQAQLFTLVFAGKTSSVSIDLANTALAVCYTAAGDEFTLGMGSDADGLVRSQRGLFSSSVSVSSEAPSITVVPNPSQAGSKLQLKIAAGIARSTSYEIQIVDALGRTLVQRSISSDDQGTANLGVETGTWAPGLYTVALYDQNGGIIASDVCVIR